uniref:Uncharacterized protein n=1 Tax=Anopheles quadriannulatus TaxID=34691 RepID=A0A182XPL3_ANOQN
MDPCCAAEAECYIAVMLEPRRNLCLADDVLSSSPALQLHRCISTATPLSPLCSNIQFTGSDITVAPVQRYRLSGPSARGTTAAPCSAAHRRPNGSSFWRAASAASSASGAITYDSGSVISCSGTNINTSNNTDNNNNNTTAAAMERASAAHRLPPVAVRNAHPV